MYSKAKVRFEQSTAEDLYSTYHLISTLYLSRHFILVEIMCAKQSEFKFLSLPLKSCQNVSQENQSFKGTVSLESVQTETVGS